MILMGVPSPNRSVEQSMLGSSEQESLAYLRTLLAIDRNYLAEERTILAQFRTGISLIVIASPSYAIISFFLTGPQQDIILDLLEFSAFLGILVLGLVIALFARRNLKHVQAKRIRIREVETEVIKATEPVYRLFREFIDPECPL